MSFALYTSDEMYTYTVLGYKKGSKWKLVLENVRDTQIMYGYIWHFCLKTTFKPPILRNRKYRYRLQKGVKNQNDASKPDWKCPFLQERWRAWCTGFEASKMFKIIWIRFNLLLWRWCSKSLGIRFCFKYIPRRRFYLNISLKCLDVWIEELTSLLVFLTTIRSSAEVGTRIRNLRLRNRCSSNHNRMFE